MYVVKGVQDVDGLVPILKLSVNMQRGPRELTSSAPCAVSDGNIPRTIYVNPPSSARHRLSRSLHFSINIKHHYI